MKVIFVPGTFSWDGKKKDWYSPDSALSEALRGDGIEQLDPVNPYVWSTDLGGLSLFRPRRQLVWQASGVNLFQYAVPPRCLDRRVPPDETVVLSHSHGLQVVLYAAAAGLKIDTFVDVAGPVREDMKEIAKLARPNIRSWVHIHAGRRDRWQWYGTLFDGRFGIIRTHPLADRNVSVPTADHGGVLREGPYFPIVRNALTGRYK